MSGRIDAGTGWAEEWSCSLASALLAPWLPDRLRHSLAAADQASLFRGLSRDADVLLLANAVALHDIGYSPRLVDTGFHPIDGARYLRAVGIDERIVSIVAHHSCARIEADLRGLTKALRAFDRAPAQVEDRMIFCDMTTSPTGQRVTPSERLAEIAVRYRGNATVETFVAQGSGLLISACERVERTLATSSQGRTGTQLSGVRSSRRGG